MCVCVHVCVCTWQEEDKQKKSNLIYVALAYTHTHTHMQTHTHTHTSGLHFSPVGSSTVCVCVYAFASVMSGLHVCGVSAEARRMQRKENMSNGRSPQGRVPEALCAPVRERERLACLALSAVFVASPFLLHSPYRLFSCPPPHHHHLTLDLLAPPHSPFHRHAQAHINKRSHSHARFVLRLEQRSNSRWCVCVWGGGLHAFYLLSSFPSFIVRASLCVKVLLLPLRYTGGRTRRRACRFPSYHHHHHHRLQTTSGEMLRRSCVTRFIVPSSSSPELPRFLSERQKPILSTNSDLYAFVVEYDHRSTMPYLFRGPVHSDFFSRYFFSGSLMAGLLTAGGGALYVLTFGYHVGKTVIDAHREFLWRRAHDADGKRSREKAEGTAAEENEKVRLSPVEEFDDVIEVKEEEG
ncbi:hypothetical predicted transmembrane protein [Leishmania tarentolae]|uniref:Hypothetical predicted transmembrane protein n=1 Tax=Leishmania tarentolae TaxID=5689 RepID=A0A640KMK0_LEITA|nr:hypothetical predicted transmembrane protein [Leishmania tarentolae]